MTRTIFSGCLLTNRRIRSICSRASCTESRCCDEQGTYADQNCNRRARERHVSAKPQQTSCTYEWLSHKHIASFNICRLPAYLPWRYHVSIHKRIDTYICTYMHTLIFHRKLYTISESVSEATIDYSIYFKGIQVLRRRAPSNLLC